MVKCCDLDDFVKAMADETRQRILGFLQHSEMNVGELTQALGLTQPTISHHLGILRRAGLVFSCREGKQVFYRLSPACVADYCREILTRFNIPIQPELMDPT
ncbi:MAG: ArsR/SmtB family transcription factor [Anaerolineaceae bacterium]